METKSSIEKWNLIKTHAIKGQLLENLEKVNKIKPLIAWTCFKIS
jgi:hypothetical protein